MTPEQLEDLREQFRPLVEAAIARGEDLSSPADMERFLSRMLERDGYALRGDVWLRSSN